MLAQLQWLYETLCSDAALSRAGQAKVWRLVEQEAAAWTQAPEECAPEAAADPAEAPADITPQARETPEQPLARHRAHPNWHAHLLPDARKRAAKDDGWQVRDPGEEEDSDGGAD